MSLKDMVGLGSSYKVRYAVVGLGDIAQEAMLPGIALTGNSAVVALVTSDAVKAKEVGKRYGVTATCDYDKFAELIRSGSIDAIYLATPNWLHAKFAVPALQAGIHVLVEKPLEISTASARKSSMRKRFRWPNSWWPIDCILNPRLYRYCRTFGRAN